MQDLQEVIKLLSEEVFDDSGPDYYLLIDDLDRGWADDRIRYKLVRALIESIKRLRRIRKVKILISMRTDLLEAVFSNTRDSGFQEDKYEDYFVRLKWSNDELRDLVNKRVSFMVRDKYQPTAEASVRKLFDAKVDKNPMLKYIISRTLNRPRDVIVFINECIQQASGQEKITAENVKSAEAIYSKKRVDALTQEWLSIYPHVNTHIEFLRGLPSKFKVKDVSFEHIQANLLNYTAISSPQDHVAKKAHEKLSEGFKTANDGLDFVSVLFELLYKIGILGISQPLDNRIYFSEEGLIPFNPESISKDHRVTIHPLTFQYLSTRKL